MYFPAEGPVAVDAQHVVVDGCTDSATIARQADRAAQILLRLQGVGEVDQNVWGTGGHGAYLRDAERIQRRHYQRLLALTVNTERPAVPRQLHFGGCFGPHHVGHPKRIGIGLVRRGNGHGKLPIVLGSRE